MEKRGRNFWDALNTNSAAVIELPNVRRSFYTPNYGAPDMIFLTLLESAKEAYHSTGKAPRTKTGEESAEGDSLPAEVYMAGQLLCDDNFIPARVLKTYDHHYTLDFLNGTVLLRTQLYLANQSSASYFTITVEGRILESGFVARNATTGRTLVQIADEEMKKANFFTHELPFLCFHSQLTPELAESANTSSMVDQSLEVRLSIPQNGGGTREVVVRKDKGDWQGRAEDAQSGEVLCLIPSHCFNNLAALSEALPTLLTSSKTENTQPV